MAVDATPLRVSRDYRFLWGGELISIIGRQITVVALPYQVFQLTRSSLAVGMIGLVEVLPLIVFSLLGSAFVDRVDRRSLILATEIGLATTSALLVFGASLGRPPLWFIYLVAGIQAGIAGINSPARAAALPRMIPPEHLASALALNQVMYNVTLIVGPAVGGVIIGTLGVGWAYGVDVLTFAASISAALLIRPLPPEQSSEGAARGWQAIREGFAYVRGKRVLISTFVVDLDAMVFGMPRAVFPVLALVVFKVGATGLGLMYAAPAVGALAGALTTGWVKHVRHQGRAVIWAVALWGAAITAFGLSSRFFALGLLFLAIAGAADVISAVFRLTILQLAVPDYLRGRLSALHIIVVTGGPRIGDAEAGTVASLVTPTFSVVSGGVACLVGVVLLAVLVPELRRYHAGQSLDGA
jgi:MFS family permease